MSKPQKLVIDCSTNTSEYIDLTDEEIQEIEERSKLIEIEYAKREAEAQAKAEAKSSAQLKLAALGLTAEEIAAL